MIRMPRRRPRRTEGRRAPGRARLYCGVALVVVLGVLAVALANKSALLVRLTPGETITAQFPRLVEMPVGVADVKIAGTPVGKVSAIEPTGTTASGDRGVVVTMKVDHGTRAKLGADPSAAIRPVTLLGGRYYVDLRPGGARGEFTGETIPRHRTSVPVELSEVLAALQPDARAGLQRLVTDLDRTLAAGGAAALQNLVAGAPDALRPLTAVLAALLGDRPAGDLPRLVRDLDRAAATLTSDDGQLESVLDRLAVTAAAVSGEREQLSAALAGLPQTLRTARGELADLDVTLDRIDATAGQAGPTVRALDETLRRLDPVLAQARPLLADLRPLLADARPLAGELVPAAEVAAAVLDDLRGPVLARVNGPLISRLGEAWRGTGPFAGSGGNGHLLYQELGYLAARFANVSKYFDRNGPLVNVQVGVGGDALAETPLARLLLDLAREGGGPR